LRRRVIFRPSAEADLQSIYDHIERHSPENASRFVGRIEAFCMSLADFPERGTKRNDLRPGIRVVGFERRVVIAFAVTPDAVEIAQVLYGGRDLGTALRPGAT
jgi:toxin ParE1/3/4